MGRVAQHHDGLDGVRDLGGNRTDQPGEADIDEQHLIPGVIDDVGDVVRMQPRIDGVADRLHPRGGVVNLQMAIAVPGEGADPVLRADAQPLHHPHQPPGAGFDIPPRIAVGGVFMRAGNDLGRPMMPGGVFEKG
jgi:hypothetical protein